MPSMHKASPKQWAGMMASTRCGTYAIMDGIRQNGPKPVAELSEYEAKCLPDVKTAEWVEERDGMLHLTEEGIKHLRSF